MARTALELLLTGWERAVAEADVTDCYRRIVAETVERVRSALEYHTTPHNLVATGLASAFLLPGEPEPATLTTGMLAQLGIVLEQDDEPHLYPSLFDPEPTAEDLKDRTTR